MLMKHFAENQLTFQNYRIDKIAIIIGIVFFSAANL